MLDVWGWHPADVNSEVAVTLLRGEVTTSSSRKSWIRKYCRIESVQRYQIIRIRSRDNSHPMPILYLVIQYMMWFLSGVGKVPILNVRSDVWNCVESYTIRILLACRLKIIQTSNNKLTFCLDESEPTYQHWNSVLESTRLLCRNLTMLTNKHSPQPTPTAVSPCQLGHGNITNYRQQLFGYVPTLLTVPLLQKALRGTISISIGSNSPSQTTKK